MFYRIQTIHKQHLISIPSIQRRKQKRYLYMQRESRAGTATCKRSQNCSMRTMILFSFVIAVFYSLHHLCCCFAILRKQCVLTFLTLNQPICSLISSNLPSLLYCLKFPQHSLSPQVLPLKQLPMILSHLFPKYPPQGSRCSICLIFYIISNNFLHKF